MSGPDLNLNKLFGQITSTQQSEGTQEVQREVGQSQQSSIQEQEIREQYNVPNNGNTPVLTGPNQQILQATGQRAPLPEDPAVLEENVRNALDQDPEVNESLRNFLNIKDKNTPEEREKLTKDVAKYLKEKGLPPTSANIQQALASQVQQTIRNNPELAEDYDELFNNLRGNVFSNSNLEFEQLVNTLQEEFESQGASPEEASKQALSKALGYIDDYAEENGLRTPVVAPNSAVGPAITVALIEKFSVAFDPDTSKELGVGLSGGFGIFNNLTNFLNGINEGLIVENPTAQDVQNNIAPALNAGNNVLVTLDDIANGAVELRETIPGDRVKYEEFLKVLAETVALVQTVLRELQIADARQASQTSRVEAEFATQRREARQTQIEKTLEALRKQNKNNKIFKILGIVIAILAAPLVILLLPAAAATLPVILAVVAVTLALAATFIALQEENVLSEAFQQLTEKLEEAISPKALARFVTVAIVVLLILVAVAAAGATGGAIGGLVGSVGGVLARIVALQVATQLVAQSGAIGTLTEGFFYAVKPNPTPEEESHLAIIKAVITAVTLLLIAFVGARSIGSAAKGLQAGAEQTSKTTARLSQIGGQVLSPGLQGAAGIVGAAGNINSAVNQIEVGRIRQRESEAQAVAERIDALITDLRQQVEGLLNDSEQAAQLASDIARLFFDAVSGLSNTIANLGQANIPG